MHTQMWKFWPDIGSLFSLQKWGQASFPVMFSKSHIMSSDNDSSNGNKFPTSDFSTWNKNESLINHTTLFNNQSTVSCCKSHGTPGTLLLVASLISVNAQYAVHVFFPDSRRSTRVRDSGHSGLMQLFLSINFVSCYWTQAFLNSKDQLARKCIVLKQTFIIPDSILYVISFFYYCKTIAVQHWMEVTSRT